MEERLAGYDLAVPDVLASFGSLRTSAALVACTSSSYLLGPDGDDALCTRLESALDMPVATATVAVRSTLFALGCREVVLVSPYPASLMGKAVAFFRAAGIAVEALHEIPTGAGGIYALTPAEVASVAQGLPVPKATAVLFSGTGTGK